MDDFLDDFCKLYVFFFFQAEDGIRDRSPSRGLGDVYKRQTIPLGIVLEKDNLVIICHRNNEVLDDFFSRSGKGITIENKIDLILHLFLRTTMFYHRYLKQINNQTGMIEQDLEKSTRNQELHRLLKMEKC